MPNIYIQLWWLPRFSKMEGLFQLNVEVEEVEEMFKLKSFHHIKMALVVEQTGQTKNQLLSTQMMRSIAGVISLLTLTRLPLIFVEITDMPLFWFLCCPTETFTKEQWYSRQFSKKGGNLIVNWELFQGQKGWQFSNFTIFHFKSIYARISLLHVWWIDPPLKLFPSEQATFEDFLAYIGWKGMGLHIVDTLNLAEFSGFLPHWLAFTPGKHMTVIMYTYLSRP